MSEPGNHEEARKIGLLALLLHNELCCATHLCGGAKDYMAAAERLFPQLAEHVFQPAGETCPECLHPRDEHVDRWCRVPTGAKNLAGQSLICACMAVAAAPQTKVRIRNSQAGESR